MGYGNAGSTSWLGVLLGIMFIAAILLGTLLGGSELFNPWSAQGEENRRQAEINHLESIWKIEEQEKQQLLIQQQQDHEAWLALREKMGVILANALATAIVAVGIGGGIFLIALGIALLLEQKRLADRGASGKQRVLPFPSLAQGQAKRWAVGS